MLHADFNMCCLWQGHIYYSWPGDNPMFYIVFISLKKVKWIYGIDNRRLALVKDHVVLIGSSYRSRVILTKECRKKGFQIIKLIKLHFQRTLIMLMLMMQRKMEISWCIYALSALSEPFINDFIYSEMIACATLSIMFKYHRTSLMFLINKLK